MVLLIFGFSMFVNIQSALKIFVAAKNLVPLVIEKAKDGFTPQEVGEISQAFFFQVMDFLGYKVRLKQDLPDGEDVMLAKGRLNLDTQAAISRDLSVITDSAAALQDLVPKSSNLFELDL